MSPFIVLSITLAVLLFWALGAYNRLVRLRAQVIGSFGPLAQRLEQALLVLVSGTAGAPATEGATAPEPDDRPAADPSGLHAAAAQLTQCLRVARRQPLDADAVAALGTAFETVHGCWLRLQPDVAARSDADPAAYLPEQRSWDDHTQLVREAIQTYNQAVVAYNGAIAQFPALLLAYLFGFKAAQCL